MCIRDSYYPELETRLLQSGKESELVEVRRAADLANIFYVRQKETKGLGPVSYTHLLALNQAEFLELVEGMAEQVGITLDRDSLRAEAVKWEMRNPGRTPRTAKQFIASLSL